MFGVLNVYKPVGMTSHDVVSYVRKLTNIRQVGHSGTLDPFAEGVLPICIGKATRLIEYFTDDKEYIATLQFGAETSTYDIEGEKIFVSDKKVTKSEVVNALKSFEGDIEQIPPIYSAIKVNGKKLYDYARKGESVEIKPRHIFIERIELKSFNKEIQQAEILIKCSKGTYIRSIAHDLGKILNCGAYLVKLIRTQAGNLRIENSTKLDDLVIEENIINPVKMINLPKIEVNLDDIKKIKNGVSITKDISVSSFVLLVYNNDEICAVGLAEKGVIKVKKVFLE